MRHFRILGPIEHRHRFTAMVRRRVAGDAAGDPMQAIIVINKLKYRLV